MPLPHFGGQRSWEPYFNNKEEYESYLTRVQTLHGINATLYMFPQMRIMWFNEDGSIQDREITIGITKTELEVYLRPLERGSKLNRILYGSPPSPVLAT